MRPHLLLALYLVFGSAGCAVKHEPGLIRLLPAGMIKEPLVVRKMSRMGFAVSVGDETTVRCAVPPEGRTIRVGFCIPEGGATAMFAIGLRRGNGDAVQLFSQMVGADEWYETEVDVRSYLGETVTLVLSSEQTEGASGEGQVYWSTPVVMTGGSERPCVVLISIDSLRSDHVGCYGYGRRTTPNLDSLAATGFLFTRSVAQSSWTLPSHASLLTSLFVKTHGACGAEEGVSTDALVIAEELRRAGYATAAFVSGPFLLPRYGMNQGFDVYDAGCSSLYHGDSHHDVTNPCVHRRATEWLESWGDAPFFLFLHYWDVHYDYIPPAPYDTLFDPGYEGLITGRNFAHNELIRAGMPQRDLEHVIALYDGEIAYTDEYLGKLFRHIRTLGIAGKCLIVATSDHGDEFLEHGATGHGHTLYQELIHVPLIWAEPFATDGPVVVDDVVQLVDVAPTVLEYLGLGPPAALEGESFLRRLRGRSLRIRPAFSETRSGGFLKAVVGTDTKIIRAMLNDQTKAYDLRHDPAELSPMPPESLSGTDPLTRALDGFLEEGKVTLELRVAGVSEGSDLYAVRLLLSDPPLDVRPHDLEPDDSVRTPRLPPTVSLTLRCGPGDVDGLSVVLPSAATSVKLTASLAGAAVRPEQVRLGMVSTPDRLPMTVTAGDPRLRVPPTNIPSLPGGGPAIWLWKVDTRALVTAKVELDEDLADQLRALGYLQ